MLMSSRMPGVLYSATSSYKPSHGVIGFMMSCAASVILLRVMFRLLQDAQMSAQNLWVAGGLSVLACLLFYWGSTWFFSFVTGYMRKLTVSEGGIRHGSVFFSWPQVREISVRMHNGCFQIHVVLRRGWLARRWLLTDEGMGREMAEEFIESVRLQILPQHPQLEIARLPALPQVAAEEEPDGVTDAETSR